MSRGRGDATCHYRETGAISLAWFSSLYIGTVVKAVGMWESRIDFQGRWEKVENLILVFHAFHSLKKCLPRSLYNAQNKSFAFDYLA